MKHYEIYTNSAYGSDVVVKDTLEEAIKEAQEWSMNLIDCDVFIVEVDEKIIKSFRHGSELG